MSARVGSGRLACWKAQGWAWLANARALANDLRGAANLATAENGFYNITVRDMAARMSTRDETVNAGLNDFVAAWVKVMNADRYDLG